MKRSMTLEQGENFRRSYRNSRKGRSSNQDSPETSGQAITGESFVTATMFKVVSSKVEKKLAELKMRSAFTARRRDILQTNDYVNNAVSTE